MRVSLKWLADYVDLVLPPEELAHRLTMGGCEVAKIDRIGALWEHIYVGQVVTLVPHPNADRLQLVTIEYGKGTVTVVAGAFNIKVGDKVPIALAGAKVFDPYSPEPRVITVKPTKLRGIVSHGMACSQKELGISDDHTGIMVLAPEAEVGRPLQDELGDVIFELNVTPNRPDLLSMSGVAREVAALTGQALVMPPLDYEEAGPLIDSLIGIEIVDPDLCARYSATYLQDVRVGPSPKWLRRRIIAAGMRPINNIVDVTNYVMLEWGQPLHAFDYEALRGRRIIVRRARPGERLTSLDGVERVLTPEMLVIADAQGPVAVAGIMGGAASEVTGATRNILLEAANFNPVSIRRTSRALRLPSEASRRFEKGLPPEQTADAARRATRLMKELAGGKVAKGVGDCYPRPQGPRYVSLTPREVRRVLGIKMDTTHIAQTLAPLGFVSQVRDDEVIVRVPIHRGDASLPADLTEEIARIVGYEEIPSATLSGPLPALAVNEQRRWEEVVRDVFVGAGFSEIICYSLTSRDRLSRLVTAGSPEAGPAVAAIGSVEERGLAAAVDRRLAWTAWPPVTLVNPLSAESDSLRTTAFGCLLETLHDNLRHEHRDVLLFEIGRLYIPRDGELPEERRVITAVTGELHSGRLWGAEYDVDFFDLKGLAEELLNLLGIKEQRYVPLSHPMFQPGRAAAVLIPQDGKPAIGRGDGRQPAVEGELVGVVGEVQTRVRANFDIAERAYLLALDFDRLLRHATFERTCEPLPRYPAVLQDIAVIVAEDVPATAVRHVILEAGGLLVRDVELFDVYRGAPIPPGKSSLAYRVTFQSNERTLTDEEVNGIRERVVGALAAQLGATLRG